MATKTTKNSTLADVALAAGVTSMTVSRFLRRTKNVSPKVAARIEAAVIKLNYRPNLAAKMLMGQPSNAIGLIVPTLADTFYSTVAHSVQHIARQRGLLAWVAASEDDLQTEVSLISQMQAHHVDGILVVPSVGMVHQKLPADCPPLVALDRPLSSRSYDAVLVENRKGARAAVEHLLQHGYRRILCLCMNEPDGYTARERMGGYSDAMTAAGLKPQSVASLFTQELLDKTLRKAMSGKAVPHAIFAANHVTTVHVLTSLREMGKSVPKDVALFGFDDFELASFVRPSISVVRQPGEILGREAAEQLFARMAAKAPFSKGVRTVLPVELIVRESCGCNVAGCAQGAQA